MRYVTRAMCGFPLLLLTSFYATWAAGRLALGYWPRSSLDDPKNIEGGLFSVVYSLTQVLALIGPPLFWFAALGITLVCLFRKQEGWEHRLSELAVALVLFFGVVAFTRWDPQSVVDWYFD